MLVISVLNQKGGSGKTTIATHLARAFQVAGHDVLLIDSDPREVQEIGPQCVMSNRCQWWG